MDAYGSSEHTFEMNAIRVPPESPRDVTINIDAAKKADVPFDQLDDQSSPSSPTHRQDETDPDPACPESVSKQITTSKISAAMLLMTWSTSSSNVMYPWTFGVLGVIFGPLSMFFAFAVNYICTIWTIEAALRTGSKTLGELGQNLFGMPGRILLEGSQLLFQQLFLPVAIVLSADALRSMLEQHDSWFGCNIHVTALFVVSALVLMQAAQQLGHAMIFAYISIGLIVVQTICILYSIGNTSPTNSEEVGGWEYFVGQGSHGDRYKWYNVFSAFGVYIYSCLPNCIVIETMATMENPEEMKQAASFSFGFYITVYLATGIPAVLAWGGDVSNPITSVMENDWSGVMTKMILIYSTMLDFVIASTTVNRWLMTLFAPQHDFSMTLPNAVRWGIICIPSATAATLMALFVPRLDSLTGLLNSVTGSTVQITGISLLLLLTTNAAITGTFRPNKVLVIGALLVGLALTITIFVETVYSVGWLTHYDDGDFWCDVVG